MPLVDSDIVSLLADLLPRAIVTISIVTMPLFESGIVSKLADPLLMVQWALLKWKSIVTC